MSSTGQSSGSSANADGNPSDKKPIPLTMAISAVLIVILVGVLVWFWQSNQEDNPAAEVQMGVIIVMSVVILMTLLFAISSGFSAIDLSDRGQALGLPEGSIRAMIALVLIMIFVILSIYLFRETNRGTLEGPICSKVTLQDESLNDIRAQIALALPNDPLCRDDQTGFYVRGAQNEDGARFAQQLLTTLGTLVVAVAGFYFGTSSVESAHKRQRDRDMEELAMIGREAGGGGGAPGTRPGRADTAPSPSADTGGK